MQHRVFIVRWGRSEAVPASMIWLRLNDIRRRYDIGRAPDKQTFERQITASPVGTTASPVQSCASIRRLHLRIRGNAKFSANDHSASRELTKLSAIASSEVPISSIADSCR